MVLWICHDPLMQSHILTAQWKSLYLERQSWFWESAWYLAPLSRLWGVILQHFGQKLGMLKWVVTTLISWAHMLFFYSSINPIFVNKAIFSGAALHAENSFGFQNTETCQNCPGLIDQYWITLLAWPTLKTSDWNMHFGRWNENAVILMKFSSLFAPEVVIVIIYSTASDENFNLFHDNSIFCATLF